MPIRRPVIYCAWHSQAWRISQAHSQTRILLCFRLLVKTLHRVILHSFRDYMWCGTFNSTMLSQSNMHKENFSFCVFIFRQLVFLGVAGRLLCFSPVRNCFRLGDKILQTERDRETCLSLFFASFSVTAVLGPT